MTKEGRLQVFVDDVLVASGPEGIPMSSPLYCAVKKSKIFGMIRDALKGIGGSSLSIFTGFLNNFEKLNFQKLKIDQNRFKMG